MLVIAPKLGGFMLQIAQIAENNDQGEEHDRFQGKSLDSQRLRGAQQECAGDG
jgi:hypothetical protein